MQHLDKKSVRVELDKDEYTLAITTGVNRAESHPDSTPMGKSNDAIRSHPEGAVGEMMVCKYFGVNFDNTIKETGIYPGDTDLMIGDKQVDVKGTTWIDDPYLLVKKKLAHIAESDIYIAVMMDGEGDIPHVGHIVGWAWHSVLIQQEPQDFPPKYPHMNYTQDWKTLNNIRELWEEFSDDDIERESPIVRESTSDVLEEMDTEWLSSSEKRKSLRDFV